MAEALLIGGQAVIPQRLLSQGFTFTYDSADHALQQIWKG
jgi:NAD dependent epimerase/dehydratase family enzyme